MKTGVLTPVFVLFRLSVRRRFGRRFLLRGLLREKRFLIFVLRADFGHSNLVNSMAFNVDDFKSITAVFNVVG